MRLSNKELKRANIIPKYISGLITLESASRLLDLSKRQITRLKRSFLKTGVMSFKHGNCGKSPTNKTPKDLEIKILEFFRNHSHMIPSIPYLREKLIEDNIIDFVPSESTLRRILKEANLGRSYSRKRSTKYKIRQSYSREGTMLQLDGSYHKWFGGKDSCLISIVDDATSKIVAAKFCKAETTIDCLDVIDEVIKNNGKPEIIFTDRAGVYSSRKREGFSSVEKALYELDILPLFAYSPQSKGKVERHFRTLQERLIADLAWKNIRDLEQANKYLKEVFIEKYNHKFGRIPQENESAYRKNNQDLREILSRNEYRRIGNGDTFSYNNNKYIVCGKWNNLKNRTIQIKQYLDGTKKYFVEGIEVRIEQIIISRSA